MESSDKEEIIKQIEELKSSQIWEDLNKILSPKHQIQSLQDEVDSNQLDQRVRELKEYRKKVNKETNIFRIIRSRSTEDKISDFYGWLLKPDESHPFGEVFLKRFLEKVFEKDEEKSYSDYSNLKDNADVEIRTPTERGIPDFIFYLSKEDGEKFGCIMESKISEDAERTDQLPQYREWGDKKFGDDKLLIFLTKNGRKPKYEEEGKKDEWIKLSHEKILEMIKDLFNEGINNIEDEVLVKQFKEYLGWKLVDEEVKDKCEKFWEKEKYEQGLEKVFEYGLRVNFHKALKARLEEENWFNDYEYKPKARTHPVNKIELWKEKWKRNRSGIFFKVNPRDPKGELISVKIHNKEITLEKGGFMNKSDHEKLQKEIKENLPKNFRVPENSKKYVRTFCEEYEEFKAKNYHSLLEWTVEILRQLNNEYSEIIDEAIDKAMNE